MITKFPKLEEIDDFNRFQPLAKNITSQTLEDDFIVLTQKPDYAVDPRWKNESQRNQYVEENKLRFLRRYQLRAVRRIQEEINVGKDRFLFEMATGNGQNFNVRRRYKIVFEKRQRAACFVFG